MTDARDLAPPIAEGTRLGSLTLRSLLGRGAMGAVFLASHSILDFPVVVKVMTGGTDPEAIFDEARLAARIRSPHVVEVLDGGRHEGRPYVVQRYIDGLDWGELLAFARRAGRLLPSRFLARMFADAALGLHSVHQAGVIHRDIKPQNLFCEGAGRSLIGDFGLAFDPARVVDTLPSSGTPLYMSPEQWRHDGVVDRRSDIYSLGATAYHMLAGSPPFQKKSLEALARAHRSERHEWPAPADPVQGYLIPVIDRMIQKDPEHRVQSAHAVARLIEPVAGRRPPIREVPDGFQVGRLTLAIRLGDIAVEPCDVIGNNANPQHAMRVGVAGHLREQGGDEVEAEARAQAPSRLGEVIWTGPGRLPARFVAHAVPGFGGALCIQRALLRLLLEAELRVLPRVHLPPFGTGLGGAPTSLAAAHMLKAIRTFAALEPEQVREVTIITHQPDRLAILLETARGASEDEA